MIIVRQCRAFHPGVNTTGNDGVLGRGEKEMLKNRLRTNSPGTQ